MDGEHKRGRVCSLASWYESDRIGISERRTDDISAGDKVVFIDLGGKESFQSFLLSEPFLQLFLQNNLPNSE